MWLPTQQYMRTFSPFSGRLNRKSYAIGEFIVLVTSVLLFVTLVLLGKAILGDNSAGLLIPSLLVAYLAAFLAHLSLNLRRLHDLGWHGSLAVCVVVPGVNAILLLCLLLLRGEEKPNKHGGVPAKRVQLRQVIGLREHARFPSGNTIQAPKPKLSYPVRSDPEAHRRDARDLYT